MNKKEKIKQTLKETREKRLNQICKSYELKIDISHCSKEQLNFLSMLFIEAKWLYNYCLNQEDVFKIDTKIKEVIVLNKNKEVENRKLKYLNAQLIQTIIQMCQQNIFNLSKTKKKGLKVGRLKYKKEVLFILLRQYGMTHEIKNKKYFRITGMKKYFKVNGLDQIKENYEFANANLIKRNNNFYIKLVTYQNKENKAILDNQIGIDFGIKDNFTFSNGIKIKTNFDYNNIKQEQRKLSKKITGSKNHGKQKLKLNKKYEKLLNQKKDVKNKLVSYLKNNYNIIAVQDENIKTWNKKYSSKIIQTSILGITLSELKKHDKTKIVDKWFPTTKMCYKCGKINKIKLSERTYNCLCGLSEDRDVKSAKTILLVAEGLSDFKPVEKQTTAKMLNYFNNFVSHISTKQEANNLVDHDEKAISLE